MKATFTNWDLDDVEIECVGGHEVWLVFRKDDRNFDNELRIEIDARLADQLVQKLGARADALQPNGGW